MRAALALALVAIAATLAPTAFAQPGRIAVGVLPGASVDETALLVEATAGVAVDRSLEPIGALVVDVPDVEAVQGSLSALPGVQYVEPLNEERRLVFQAVHMIMEGDLQAPWRDGEDRYSRMVFIGRNLDEAALREGFEACVA